MAYADENYYKNKYLSGREAVITSAFDFYFLKATKIIDRYTFNRITQVSDDISNCCCEIAELIFSDEQLSKKTENGGKSSESVGSWSVSYASQQDAKITLESKIQSALRYWLPADLLYRGVDNAR